MVAEILALVDIAQVQLQHRFVDRADRIHDGNGAVSIGGGIQDDPVRLGGMDQVNHRAFMVALLKLISYAQRPGLTGAHGFDIL